MKMNQYEEMYKKQQKEVNDFPIQFAFNAEQFKQGMENLGLTVEDKDKVVAVVGGGFIRKTDEKAFLDMFRRHKAEIRGAIAADETGEGFIYEMFLYELKNHEYGYTRDVEPALDALNLTFEQVANDEKLSHGLEKAKLMA